MGFGTWPVEPTLQPGSGLGEDTAILGKWSAEGGNITLKTDDIL